MLGSLGIIKIALRRIVSACEFVLTLIRNPYFFQSGEAS